MSNQLFKLDISEDTHLRAKLLYLSKSKYNSDWHSTMHSHNFTECIYVTRGRGLFCVEKSEFNVEENDLIIINPGVDHVEKFAGDINFEYIAIGIDSVTFNFIDPKNPSSLSEYTILHYKRDKDLLETYINIMLSEFEKQLLHKNIVCQNILELIVINILRKTTISMSAEEIKSTNSACRIIKKYIDENFRNPITLKELASIAKVNKYYLSHSFTADYNISPINYLISKRIEESKHLLLTTNYSISSISEFTGFSSPSYFSQCFKRNMGVQPEVYRKQFTKIDPDN